MSWLGKIIGGAFGFLMGGPVGGLFGAAVGHHFDRELSGHLPHGRRWDDDGLQRVQLAFFTATFSVMGHVAKSDGRVTEAEIQLARNVMNRLELPDELRRNAIRLFTDGKRADFPLADSLRRFHAECRHNYSLIRLFIELQLEAALADGALQQTEEALLLQICDRLHFSRFEFHTMRASLEAQLRISGRWRYDRSEGPARQSRNEPSLSDAYAALGVKPNVSDAELTRAYRRMMSQHHPDKLVAEGLPEEMVKLANEKTQQIRKAYELIRKARHH